jgi:hypothetical protein
MNRDASMVKKVRRPVGRALRRIGLRPPLTPPWVEAEEQPATPEPIDEFRLFGIIGSWMEADVIAATVANAFTQGCERVFLVDNDSPDDTVAQAIAAGAEFACRFSSPQYDEVLRLKIMNHVVETVSEEDGSDHIWWLWLDADEFPHAPRGATIRQFLEPLDRRFRIVGGRVINHFPSGSPAYVPGYHPLDFQPLCEEHRQVICSLSHRKHPLQRYDKHGPLIVCDRGFHRATSAERPLREPMTAVYVHHFPYREPDATRRRLAALCGIDESGVARARSDDDATDAMIPRFQTLDAVYSGDWARVRNYRFEGKISVPHPVPWESLAGPDDAPYQRWYGDVPEIGTGQSTAN